MAKSPIRREAGQTVEEMACQMEAAKQGNRMYKAQYNEVSAALKAEQFSAALDQQIELLSGVRKNGKIDLDNLAAVEATATRYIESCKRASVVPTILGLSAALGYSRKTVWQYITQHPESRSAQYLDALRSAFAAVLAQLGLSRNTSEAVSIFLLKNSGQGLTDKTEIDIAARQESPLGEKADPEELRRKYLEDAYGVGYADDENSQDCSE